MYGVIYKITDTTNGKIYIGQTTRTVEERFQEHMDSPFLIGRAIRKHGVEKFTIEVIATCESKEELDAQEIRFIAEYDCITPKGYNCKTGGEGGFHCEETKAQISQTMTGTKQTDEHRANNLVAQHKRWFDPAEHEKASAAQRKRYEDPAERAKTSEALKKSRAKNPLSPESHAQQAESLRKFYEEHPEARQHLAYITNKQFETAEARQQHSELMIQYYREHPISAETREKQSESLQNFYAEHPDERRKISERNQQRFEDPNEREKVSIGLKKYYAENPDAATRMSEAQKKSYAEHPEKRIKQSVAQKARRTRERIAKMPEMVAQQNLSAAQLPAKITLP